jgi:RhtX/FptX family siderophore transporter
MGTLKTPAKLAVLSSLYISQGLPYGFFTQALPALMRQRGLSLPEIGLANLLALPWALKFLLAPYLDRNGFERLGKRRGFILPLQLMAVLALWTLAAFDPARGLTPLMVGVFVVNALAASQDIATDALAVDMLDAKERGLGNGIQVAGYRVGMILGGGALLVAFDRLGWVRSFVTLGVVLLIATLPIMFYREPKKPHAPPVDQPGGETFWAWFLRPGIPSWLGLLLIYKSGEALATGILRPFLVDRGLSLADLGWLVGTVGFAAGLIGAMLGGVLVNVLGRRVALAIFGLLQSVAVGGYALMAHGLPLSWLYAVTALEHLASGMATAALFTAMMDICRAERAATDYTIQACAVVVATGAAQALSGFSAQHLGYVGHFSASAMLSVLGAIYVVSNRSMWTHFYRAQKEPASEEERACPSPSMQAASTR